MKNFNRSSYDQGGQFRRRWIPVHPPTRKERRLAELRALHGNIEGRRRFVVELHGPEVAEWL